MPIDEALDTWSSLLPSDKLKDYQVDGKQYAIPATIAISSVIYYDKDLLAQVGTTHSRPRTKILKRKLLS